MQLFILSPLCFHVKDISRIVSVSVSEMGRERGGKGGVCNGGFIHAEPARSHHPSSSHRHSPLFAHGGLLSSLFLSLRIPFFYHLASPLPVEASCIQRSKSCSVSKSERRLHKITNSIHSLKQPRRVSSLLAQYSICGFAGLFNFSFHFEGSRRFPSRSVL